MNRTEFVNELIKEFKKVVPSDVTISVETAETGEILYLTIGDGKKIGISVGQMHDIYNETHSLEDVVKSVSATYKNALSVANTFENFEDAKGKIHFALVNKNHAKFNEVNNPHIAMEDLRLLLAVKIVFGDNVMTTFVTKDMLKMWDVTFEELYKIAENNSESNLFRMTDTFWGISGNPTSYGAGELWGKKNLENIQV